MERERRQTVFFGTTLSKNKHAKPSKNFIAKLSGDLKKIVAQTMDCTDEDSRSSFSSQSAAPDQQCGSAIIMRDQCVLNKDSKNADFLVDIDVEVALCAVQPEPLLFINALSESTDSARDSFLNTTDYVPPVQNEMINTESFINKFTPDGMSQKIVRKFLRHIDSSMDDIESSTQELNLSKKEDVLYRPGPYYKLPRLQRCNIYIASFDNWYDLVEGDCATRGAPLPDGYCRPMRFGEKCSFRFVGDGAAEYRQRRSLGLQNARDAAQKQFNIKRRYCSETKNCSTSAFLNSLFQDPIQSPMKKMAKQLQMNTSLFCVHCEHEFQQASFARHVFKNHNVYMGGESRAMLKLLAQTSAELLAKTIFQCEICQNEFTNVYDWQTHRVDSHLKILHNNGMRSPTRKTLNPEQTCTSAAMAATEDKNFYLGKTVVEAVENVLGKTHYKNLANNLVTNIPLSTQAGELLSNTGKEKDARTNSNVCQYQNIAVSSYDTTVLLRSAVVVDNCGDAMDGGITNKGGTRLRRCTMCPYKTKHNGQMINHCKMHEPPARLYACTQCSFSSMLRRSLKNHRRFHSAAQAKNIHTKAYIRAKTSTSFASAKSANKRSIRKGATDYTRNTNICSENLNSSQIVKEVCNDLLDAVELSDRLAVESTANILTNTSTNFITKSYDKNNVETTPPKNGSWNSTLTETFLDTGPDFDSFESTTLTDPIIDLHAGAIDNLLRRFPSNDSLISVSSGSINNEVMDVDSKVADLRNGLNDSKEFVNSDSFIIFEKNQSNKQTSLFAQLLQEETQHDQLETSSNNLSENSLVFSAVLPSEQIDIQSVFIAKENFGEASATFNETFFISHVESINAANVITSSNSTTEETNVNSKAIISLASTTPNINETGMKIFASSVSSIHRQENAFANITSHIDATENLVEYKVLVKETSSTMMQYMKDRNVVDHNETRNLVKDLNVVHLTDDDNVTESENENVPELRLNVPTDDALINTSSEDWFAGYEETVIPQQVHLNTVNPANESMPDLPVFRIVYSERQKNVTKARGANNIQQRKRKKRPPYCNSQNQRELQTDVLPFDTLKPPSESSKRKKKLKTITPTFALAVHETNCNTTATVVNNTVDSSGADLNAHWLNAFKRATHLQATSSTQIQARNAANDAQMESTGAHNVNMQLMKALGFKEAIDSGNNVYDKISSKASSTAAKNSATLSQSNGSLNNLSLTTMHDSHQQENQQPQQEDLESCRPERLVLTTSCSTASNTANGRVPVFLQNKLSRSLLHPPNTLAPTTVPSQTIFSANTPGTTLSSFPFLTQRPPLSPHSAEKKQRTLEELKKMVMDAISREEVDDSDDEEKHMQHSVTANKFSQPPSFIRDNSTSYRNQQQMQFQHHQSSSMNQTNRHQVPQIQNFSTQNENQQCRLQFQEDFNNSSNLNPPNMNSFHAAQQSQLYIGAFSLNNKFSCSESNTSLEFVRNPLNNYSNCQQQQQLQQQRQPAAFNYNSGDMLNGQHAQRPPNGLFSGQLQPQQQRHSDQFYANFNVTAMLNTTIVPPLPFNNITQAPTEQDNYGCFTQNNFTTWRY